MLCIQTFQHTVLLSSRLGPPLCDHCFVLADGRGFLLDAVAALGLVALKLKHFVCKRQYITALGFTQLAACFAAVTSFLGSFWVSREMKQEQHLIQPEQFRKALSPVLLFSFPRVGVGHENAQPGQLLLHVRNWCLLALLCYSFLKSDYCVFKVGAFLQNPNRN